MTIGKIVNVIGKTSQYKGEVIDINEKGKLIVKMESGEVREFISGEISIC